MIKKSLFGLFIGLISVINFSSAFSVGNTNGYSSVNTGGFFNTTIGGQDKPFLTDIINSLSLGEGYFWNNNKLYCYKGYSNLEYQGYIGKVGVCYFTGSNYQSCNYPTYYSYLEYDHNVVGEFLKGINYGDNWQLGFQGTNNTPTLIIADNDTYTSMIFICGDFFGNISNLGFQTGNLIQNFTGFESLNSSYMGTPPGYIPGSIDGSSSIGENTDLTGNLMYSTCTNGYVVSEVSSWYGGIDNICYAGTYNTGIINDGVAFSPISQGLNFKEVYNGSLNVTINGVTPYYSSYLDWFNTWMYAMQKYKLGQIDFQIFNGQPVYLYAYFDRLYQNGVVPGQTDAYNIANICKLALFSDYSKEYKGTYFRDVCDDLIYNPGNSSDVSTGEVGSIDDDLQEIIPPGSDIGTGDNFSSGTIVSVDWSGTLSGNTNKNFDGKTFINEFYQKLQANFQKPTNDLTGIVPVYIYVFLIALILFRFLSH